MESNYKNCIDRESVGKSGEVALIATLGRDEDVANAARVSYGRQNASYTQEQNRRLIRYLMRHEHLTPFEMVEVKFYVKAPMDVWRQWIRHRTASVNEVSTRYTIVKDHEENETHENEWRKQSTESKQGSDGTFERNDGKRFSKLEKKTYGLSECVYDKLINAGVAREQARKVLPLSTYTEAYWKIDLRNLFHFLRLRLAPNAQKEIREYAKAIYRMVYSIFPDCCEAFVDYQLNSVTFSAIEINDLQRFLISRKINFQDSKTSLNEIALNDVSLCGSEKSEFLEKCAQRLFNEIDRKGNDGTI